MVGTEAYNEPGGLVWEDLRSSDPDAARAFYGAVLGWEFHELPQAGADYTTFHHAGDEAPLGGLGGMMGMDSFPSHWIVYWGVADVDSAVAYAEAHGGHVLSPGFDTEFGRMAALADPSGASFWVAQLESPQTPDRERSAP
jgi:predicted enzyme related to lactoylglutathione lyase